MGNISLQDMVLYRPETEKEEMSILMQSIEELETKIREVKIYHQVHDVRMMFTSH